MHEFRIPDRAGCCIALWLVLGCSHLQADDGGFPAAWSKPPQTASEIGLRQFSQSPFLGARDLPEVRERLPDDPVVIVPYDTIGRYGGTARIEALDWHLFQSKESLATIGADLRSILPNLAEWWSHGEGGRHLTVKLRAGIKWSDGVPLTVDDFLFSFNDLEMNPAYSPVPPRIVRGGRLVKIDALTMRFEFPQPHPLFINFLAQVGDFMLVAKHYYRQFHPDYTDPAVVEARMREMGFISWTSFVLACRRNTIEESVDAPTLWAYRVVERTPTLVTYERNPYYFKVDPTGQQLPYVDRIEAEVISDDEVITAKAASGQLDFAGISLRTQDIPLLKLGERTGAIRVLIWNRLHGSDVAIQFNFNHANERLRTLFQDVRFRRALSLAIDRDEINEVVYFGRGTPRQVTVLPGSRYFDPEYPRAFAEFDPGRAGALLDEIGLVDRNGDGLREHPDGAPLTITLEFLESETPKSMTMELVRSYWRELGIDLRLKLVGVNVQWSRAEAGRMEMSLWHADRASDILFPLQPVWWVPQALEWTNSMWSEWSRWHVTDGRMGEEPPAEIQELQSWAVEMRTTMSESRRIELGRKILAVNAANVWTIGTIGLAPHPVVVSRRLRNVPETGAWGWDNRWTLPYHPATWFFGEPRP
jgi:peptide/nickel transport system substrate-binding protein